MYAKALITFPGHGDPSSKTMSIEGTIALLVLSDILPFISSLICMYIGAKNDIEVLNTTALIKEDTYTVVGSAAFAHLLQEQE